MCECDSAERFAKTNIPNAPLYKQTAVRECIHTVKRKRAMKGREEEEERRGEEKEKRGGGEDRVHLFDHRLLTRKSKVGKERHLSLLYLRIMRMNFSLV